MLPLPPDLIKRYTAFIEQRGVLPWQQRYYLKWLRYYLDFCHKWKHVVTRRDSLAGFMDKLQDKQQPPDLRKQACHAITLYYEMESRRRDKGFRYRFPQNPSASPVRRSPLEDGTPGTVVTAEPGKPRKAAINNKGADWRGVFTDLEGAVRMRNYSPKTLKAYTGWTRKLQAHVRSKDPALVTADDVKDFLSWLAVEQKVSASSQNQAFNALLFLFRNVFGREFGKVDGIVRAKRRPSIPVVLSRKEIDRILVRMKDPHRLILSLMYGCGLRISECLSLRVQNFNFDMRILTIHDGKGRKDRTVPLPEALMDRLQRQLGLVRALHEQDLRNGYDGVFLYGQLAKKYKNAARELIWQWFFPARELTHVPETGEYRRYHVHETSVQKVLRTAVRKAGVPKRVTPHTFRHSFASHLLQANYDIRTIQELLGHSDVRTTMIYTHTVKSTTIKEAKSPLDL